MNDLKNLQILLQQGKFAEVEQAANALIENAQSAHQDSEAMVQIIYLLAVSYRLQQKHKQAIETLATLLALQSKHARAHQELAYNHRALQNTKLASVHFYKATQLNPALLSAWQALLPIYEQAKQHDALVICQKQIAHLTSLPKPLLMASDLFHDGNIAAAEQSCRTYLQQDKHNLQGLLLLAEIAMALKAVGEAEFILETAIELAPQSTEAKYQLFKTYSKMGKFALGLALTKQLIEQAPDNTFFIIAHATCLVGVGKVSEAISEYHSLIEQNKANTNVYLLLGHAQKTFGNINASVEAYQKACELSPHFGDAYWSLANTKTYQFSTAEIDTMQNGIASDDVDDADKIHLCFALGKACEDKKQFDKSFEYYEKGNTLKSSQLSYSSKQHARFVDDQINVFTPDLASRLKNTGDPDKSPIFIVGLPRAGSTLLEQILASHSQVDGTMELHEILGLAATLSKKQGNAPVYPHNISQIPTDYWQKFGEKFIKDTRIYRQGGAYFIDKMPNNYLHIGLIKLILPNAKIIDARREPMACCFSGFKQLFGEGQEFSYSLSDIGEYYTHYLRLMAHWQTLYPQDILLVQHEDIIQDTEAQIRRMLAFCGLEFEKDCLDFYQNKRAVNTPSAEQVRQPIYTSGMSQWKHFEPYLEDLKKALK